MPQYDNRDRDRGDRRRDGDGEATSTSKRFKMTCDGEAHWCVSVKYTREPSGAVSASQELYINKMLKRWGMESCKPLPIPFPAKSELLKPWEMGVFKKWKRSDLLPNDRVFTSRYVYKIKRSAKTILCSSISFATARDIIRRATARPGVGEKLST